jgi:hypothetical protein
VEIQGEKKMQVSRIGIGQLMFPGFNRSFGADMTRNPYSWNRPGTPGYGSYGFPGYQGGGGEEIAAGQCYTCTNPDTQDIKSGVDAATARSLEKSGYRCRKDNCAERGGYPVDFSAYEGFGAPGMVADAAVSDFGGYGAYSSGMMGRQRSMGQVAPNAKPPLAVSYDQAARMLASAEAIIAKYPSCEMPVISRFRSYVATGAGVPSLQLSADESAQLDQFQLCAETKGVQGSAVINDTLGVVVAGLAAAALIGFLVWKG